MKQQSETVVGLSEEEFAEVARCVNCVLLKKKENARKTKFFCTNLRANTHTYLQIGKVTYATIVYLYSNELPFLSTIICLI